jgi:hypothetical protein
MSSIIYVRKHIADLLASTVCEVAIRLKLYVGSTNFNPSISVKSLVFYAEGNNDAYQNYENSL